MRAAGRMNGPNPGGSPPARIIAAQHASATSASRTPSAIAAMAAAPGHLSPIQFRNARTPGKTAA